MKRKYFGTDGIRGKVGSKIINPQFILQLGWAAGKVLAKSTTSQPFILIGKDTRHSCDLLESALASGLMVAGVNVLSLGVLPTPAVAHFTHSLQATAGVIISASHNNFEDNGVKFFSKDGRKLDDALELEIERKLMLPIEFSGKNNLGSLNIMSDAKVRYIEFCKSIFPPSLNLNGLKLVVDCAQGATCTVAKEIFSELGAEVILMANEPDGKNINDQCGSTYMSTIRDHVINQKADAGIAFDGDGDRLLMVDHNGTVVDGDELLCILACCNDNQQKAVAGVVGTAMSNLGLELALAKANIAFERTAVGDRYVLEKLLEKGWFLGGESSGHIINLNYTTTGDGLISALQILSIMQRTKKNLQNLRQVMLKRPQILINVPVKNKIEIETSKVLLEALQNAEKELQNAGRILLRSSGTEPVIRVMVEGDDEDLVQQIAEFLAEKVIQATQ